MTTKLKTYAVLTLVVIGLIFLGIGCTDKKVKALLLVRILLQRELPQLKLLQPRLQQPRHRALL